MVNMDKTDLKKLPTTRQSDLTLILGILTSIGGFFQVLVGFGSALSYRSNDGGSGALFGLLIMLFGFAFISLGNRKVINQDWFIIFLREFIKKETEKE